MIICRTPFRITFFGGGTDYPVFFKEHGGSVLAATIDKYCYISTRYLPPYFKHKSRIVYSVEEWVNYHSEIKHPSVRECLRYMNVRDGVEICHQSDLLARKGLGSSSSFTVGLLNTLNWLTYRGMDKKTLAETAVHIEQDLIKENVGCQDQFMAAYGGVRRLDIDTDGRVDVNDIEFPPSLISFLMLFDTGTQRISSDIAAVQIKDTPSHIPELLTMKLYVDDAVALFKMGNMTAIGKLLNENWKLKKSLSPMISNTEIDQIYAAALDAGAMGGKILGAGGGGYILLFCEPSKQETVKQSLRKLKYVPFRLENSGTQIIFNDENY